MHVLFFSFQHDDLHNEVGFWVINWVGVGDGVGHLIDCECTVGEHGIVVIRGFI